MYESLNSLTPEWIFHFSEDAIPNKYAPLVPRSVSRTQCLRHVNARKIEVRFKVQDLSTFTQKCFQDLF